MKIKKILSAFLAAVMVFTVTCTPAFAAGKADTLAEINKNDIIWVGVTSYAGLIKERTFNLRYWKGDAESSTWTKDKEPKSRTEQVLELPLGITLAAGPDNTFLGNIWVYSDSDGDGIYDERMEKIVWKEDGSAESSQLLPESAEGPFVETATEWYYVSFDWGYGKNFLEASLKGTPAYHILTTDYLVEKFGANTLMLFWNEDKDDCLPILLTGKEAPAGLACSPESQGVYFTDIGDVVSGWAVETVNTAIYNDLLPASLETAHNFDLTGNITRAEFATLTMYLYFALADTDEFMRPKVSPFVDVDESDPNYKYILGAYYLGIVNGTSTANKTFSPNSLVKRQDAAVMLARVYEALGGKVPAASATSFSDDGQIRDYAKSAVAFMTSKSIINGVGGNRFNPDGSATVEQTLKIALEMLNKLS